MRTQLWTSLALGALALSSPACVDVDEPPPDDAEPAGEITPLTGGRAALFGAFEVGSTWNKDYLTVCWMDDVIANASQDDRDLMEAGRAVVLKEWGRVSRVRFNTTWGNCNATPSADVRIGRMPPEGSLGRSAIGTDAQSVPAGQPTMLLQFELDVLGPCDSGNPGSLCKELRPDGLDAWDVADFEHIILHEFGHALGLRHEHARADATCNVDEELDVVQNGQTYDGEPLWTYDPSSVMNYCAGGTTLSVGDIRALNTLYPGVVGLYREEELGTLVPTRIGPGHYTATAQAGATQISNLGEMSGIVVPPGFRAKICTSTRCTYLTQSQRTLTSTYNNQLVSVTVEPAAIGADLVGYNGTSERFGLGTTPASGFLTIGDNTMSSFFVPLTRAATVYESTTSSTPSTGAVGGLLGGPQGYKLSPALDNQVSRIAVSARVVTFDGARPFSGTSYALAAGTYRASSNAPWLTAVNALAISGLDVRACTEEGALGQGAGTCWNVSQSLDLGSTPPPLRYLKVSVPLGNTL